MLTNNTSFLENLTLKSDAKILEKTPDSSIVSLETSGVSKVEQDENEKSAKIFSQDKLGDDNIIENAKKESSASVSAMGR